jgi:hypothetical protein
MRMVGVYIAGGTKKVIKLVIGEDGRGPDRGWPSYPIQRTNRSSSSLELDSIEPASLNIER